MNQVVNKIPGLVDLRLEDLYDEALTYGDVSLPFWQNRGQGKRGYCQIKIHGPSASMHSEITKWADTPKLAIFEVLQELRGIERNGQPLPDDKKKVE